MNESHKIENVTVSGRMLRMVVDGVACTIDLSEQSSVLRDASESAIKNIEVSPSGYGLHWPDIDEDLSVDGLIGIRHEIPRAVAEVQEGYGLSTTDQ